MLLEVIHDLFGNGPRTESWRRSTFQEQEEKNQRGKNLENKMDKTGELELHMGSIKQRAPGAPETRSELVLAGASSGASLRRRLQGRTLGGSEPPE